VPSPADVMQAWGDAFHARDLDAMMGLFEPKAVWVSQDGDVASGVDEIRKVFSGFMASDATFETERCQVVETDGIALLSAAWTLRGPDSEVSGRTADVLRRQPDGQWLYLIDSPFGGG
jgi:uncharacterized protein (TIGR02246 family)